VGYQLAQIPARTADIHFVIDKLFLSGGRGAPLFARRLDLARLGVFGHSLGGMAAAQACLADSRIHACMNQDADFQGRPYADTSVQISLRQPFLFFVTPHSLYMGRRTVPPTDESLASQKLTRVQYDSIVHQYQKNQDNALTGVAGGSYRVNAEAPDFTHRSFMDFRLLNAAGDPAALARHERYLTIVRAYTRAFFDKYLKGRSDSLLDGSAVIDSAVTVDRFQPRPR
jgi:predicted dienelactone hydrolase